MIGEPQESHLAAVGQLEKFVQIVWFRDPGIGKPGTCVRLDLDVLPAMKISALSTRPFQR
jgi:hypothetical protein